MFKKITEVDPKRKDYFRNNPGLFPIRSAEALLNRPNLTPILKKLPTRDIVNIPEAHYQVLYNDVLHNFAYFVQGLPAIKFKSHNYHCGLLELGIERTFKALRHYRAEHPVRHLEPDQVPPQLALWTYALFTAALFYGLGQVEAIYWVSVCNAKGQQPHRWRPLAEAMRDLGTHYRYTFEAISQDDLAARATPLIAKQLMPEEGFTWIASDQEVFAFWLAILQNDERASGFLIKHIMYAEEELLTEKGVDEQIAISTMPDESEEPQEDQKKKKKDKKDKEKDKKDEKKEKADESKEAVSPDALKDPLKEKSALDVASGYTFEIGEFFINWLRNAVVGHGVTIHRMANGQLTVGADAFQAFLRDNPQYRGQSWQGVMQQVDQKHGIGGQQRLQQYQSSQQAKTFSSLSQPQQKTTGIVLDPATVFNTVAMPAHIQVSSVTRVSAAAVAKGLPNLNARGPAPTAKK